jgi:hypothetical protein
MDLGRYASYPLPAPVKTAFGADTAQQLADQLGASGTLTPELAGEAERAYDAFRRGDTQPARSLLTSLGLSDATADDVITKLSHA